MSATATLKQVFCVKVATGVDIGVFKALASVPERVDLGPFGGELAAGLAAAIPNVIAAIDTAGDNPDELFITTSTEGELENAIWPAPSGDREPTPVPVHAGQTVRPDVEIGVDFSQNVSLWDADLGFLSSANDLLGSITILESEQGEGDIAKPASSDIEGSLYFVSYRVD